MPIDPTIALGVQAPQIQSPFEAIEAIAQLQGIREQTEARRLAAEKARQQAMDEAAIRRVMTEAGGDWEKALPQLRTIAPSAAAKLETDIAETRNKTLEGLSKTLANRKTVLETGINVARIATPENYPQVRQMLMTLTPDAEQTLGPLFPETFDPAQHERVINMALSRKDQLDQQQKALELFTKGDARTGLATYLSTARNEQEWNNALAGAKQMGVPDAVLTQFGAWSPEAPARAAQLGITPEKRAELAGQAETRALTAAGQAQTAAHQAVLESQGAQRIAIARQRLAQGGGASTDQQDVEAIADAIISGEQPPTLTGLYRYAAPIRGALAKKGFNLATAQTDWLAAQRHFSTLNGAQQTRLRQAVDTATHSLAVIDDLAGKWKGTRFPILNRANLALAKGGAYGPEVASVATQLEAQISDLTSELANAYMGGNSPTDHALQLAAKNLSADWDEKVLKDMVGLARTNLRIRSNAIANVGAIGASPQNPYAPAAPPPSDDRVRVIGPNGETGTVPRGTTLPSGWRLQ
jgi:hypothetical protein